MSLMTANDPAASAHHNRILLVEDEPVLIHLVSIYLSSHGYLVENVIEGDKVLPKIQESRPDLIVLDIMLPKMNGYDICKQIKTHESFKTIPIIILSALAQRAEIERGMLAGANYYMTKPFDTVELLHNVQKYLTPNL